MCATLAHWHSCMLLARRLPKATVYECFVNLPTCVWFGSVYALVHQWVEGFMYKRPVHKSIWQSYNHHIYTTVAKWLTSFGKIPLMVSIIQEIIQISVNISRKVYHFTDNCLLQQISVGFFRHFFFL